MKAEIGARPTELLVWRMKGGRRTGLGYTLSIVLLKASIKWSSIAGSRKIPSYVQHFEHSEVEGRRCSASGWLGRSVVT